MRAARAASSRLGPLLPRGSSRAASSSRTSQTRAGLPPKILVQPLAPFVDARYPGPEPRATAFRLGSAIDLRALRQRLEQLGCLTLLWQGQVLLCGSSAELGQQQCSAVFLSDGCVVCWHMQRSTERLVLKLAISMPKEWRRPTQFGDAPTSVQRLNSLGLGVPLATEELHVMDAPRGVITALDQQEGVLRLTRDPLARTSHQLSISLGLAVAVRLDALERQIESKLMSEWREMEAETSGFNLSKASHRIFVAKRDLHELRYELNSEAGILDAPDLLWEHALAERLYDQVVKQFDVRRRTAMLNERLSYSMDYLSTLGEHAKHNHSVRLERMIILLILLDLCVGVLGHAQSLSHQALNILSGEGASSSSSS